MSVGAGNVAWSLGTLPSSSGAYKAGICAAKARFDTFAFEPISWSDEEIVRAAEVKSKVYDQLVEKASIRLE